MAFVAMATLKKDPTRENGFQTISHMCTRGMKMIRVTPKNKQNKSN